MGADKKDGKGTTKLIKEGHTLVLDISDEVTSEMFGPTSRATGVPGLRDIPYISRVFKDFGKREELQTLVLITPQIIVQEEEEEKIIVGGVTPRIIIQEEEEEEEKLGIEITP